MGTVSALTDALALPGEYEDAITYSLAERLAPEDGLEPSMTVVRIAATNRKALTPNNVSRRVMMNDLDRVLGYW